MEAIRSGVTKPLRVTKPSARREARKVPSRVTKEPTPKSQGGAFSVNGAHEDLRVLAGGVPRSLIERTVDANGRRTSAAIRSGCAGSGCDRDLAHRGTAVVVLVAFRHLGEVVSASEQEVASRSAERNGCRHAAGRLASLCERRHETRCGQQQVATSFQRIARKIVASRRGGYRGVALVTRCRSGRSSCPASRSSAGCRALFSSRSGAIRLTFIWAARQLSVSSVSAATLVQQVPVS